MGSSFREFAKEKSCKLGYQHALHHLYILSSNTLHPKICNTGLAIHLPIQPDRYLPLAQAIPTADV